MTAVRGRDPIRASAQSKSAPVAKRAIAPRDALAPGLYLVATPIGNLGDLSVRARDTLDDADLIACEDTRVTTKLLAHFGLHTPLLAYHDRNAERVRPDLLERLAAGARIALVSDAGTPLVSDPGYKLVRAAVARGIAVTSIPGPSAVLSALQLSALPPDRFFFAGFLPPKAEARRKALAELAPVPGTLIVFEAPPRLVESLADMVRCLGDRDAALARELTKLFEEVRRGRLSELASHYRETGPPKGEIVIVVAPAARAIPADDEALDTLLRPLLARMSARDAAAEVAHDAGVPRRRAYRRAIVLGDKP